jgi:ABC-2 type transport system permease protein
MRAALPSVIRFYVLSTYGLRGGAASLKAKAAGQGRGVSAKQVAKTVGIGLLVLLVVADLVVLFFGSNYATYLALKPAGLQDLLLLNGATSATLLVLLFGFITSLSTYSLSGGEGLILALPVRPRHLFTAKLVTTYLSEFLFAFLLMGSALGVYAWGEHPGPAFYLNGILTMLALPLIPLAFNYLVLVPLMSAARFLRNKNAVMVVGGVIGLVFALAFNFLVQGNAARMSDPAWIRENYAGPGSTLHSLGQAYLPALLAFKALSGKGLAGLGLSFVNLALGLGASALAVLLLGPAYAKSLSSFGETRLRRMASSGAFIERKIRSSPPSLALLKREIRLMNREPMYFLNGPFIVLLMPVILAVALLAQGQSLEGINTALASLHWEGTPYLMLVAAAAGAFLGSSTSITCTAVSRDAKALAWLKALPLDYADLGMSKFLHGFVFALFGSLVGGLGLGLALGLGALEILGALFIAIALSSLFTISGLWLDTAMPRLTWDNPTAAMKQNPNSVIVILGVMGVLGALGALAAFIRLGFLGFLLAYGLLPAILAGGALRLYPAFAERRLGALEV